jgi:hypothetical protein
MAVKIEHRLGIAAPAPVVWRVVSDLARWADWNPFYSKAEGRLAFGERLTLTEAPKYAGGNARVIRPTIVDWTPDAQIIWRLSQLGGLVRRTRYIEVEALSDLGVIFSNGEIWEGRLGKLAVRGRRRDLREGFEAMNEAVKVQALKAWRDEGGAPT